jgi:U32 family peptidase
MSDMEGRPMQEEPGGGYRVKIPLPVSTGSNGLLARYISKPNPAASNF